MSIFNRFVVFCMPIVPRPIVRFVAGRYVAGDTLDDAIAKVNELREEGALATMDILGESVKNAEGAQAYTRQYIELFDRIKAENKSPFADGLSECTVSLKPTMMGLNLDESLAREQIEACVKAARERDIHLTIDMEDHPYTDSTLAIYRDMLEKYGNVGTVLQSYMRRTLDDISGLPETGAHIRLCKGIYIEPRHVAWKDFDVVRANFISALRKLLKRGAYVGIATHDRYLVQAGMSLVDELGIDKDMYEFQMLLGVDPELRRIIIAGGHRLRVYVPYGKDWYPYSIRRLRENPNMVTHVMKAFFGIR